MYVMAFFILKNRYGKGKDTETFKTNNRLGSDYEICQGNSEGLGEMAEKSGNYTELQFFMNTPGRKISQATVHGAKRMWW